MGPEVRGLGLRAYGFGSIAMGLGPEVSGLRLRASGYGTEARVLGARGLKGPNARSSGPGDQG